MHPVHRGISASDHRDMVSNQDRYLWFGDSLEKNNQYMTGKRGNRLSSGSDLTLGEGDLPNGKVMIPNSTDDSALGRSNSPKQSSKIMALPGNDRARYEGKKWMFGDRMALGEGKKTKIMVKGPTFGYGMT